MALLMQWLSQAGLIPLKQGEYSFHALAAALAERSLPGRPPDGDRRRVRAARAAGAGPQVLRAAGSQRRGLLAGARLGFARHRPATNSPATIEPIDDAERQTTTMDDTKALFSAAYDDVVYIDSTGDGVDADMLESGGRPATDFELEQEARRVGERLAFLRTVASLWKKAALACGPQVRRAPIPAETARAMAGTSRPRTNGGCSSCCARSTQRRIPAALVQSRFAVGVRSAPRRQGDAGRKDHRHRDRNGRRRALDARRAAGRGAAAEHQSPLDDVLRRGRVRRSQRSVQQLWPRFLEALRSQPLLYVPLNKGGDPARLAQARGLQQALRDLLAVAAATGTVGGDVPTDRSGPADGVGQSGRRRGDQRVRSAVCRRIRGDRRDAGRRLARLARSAEDADKVDNDLVECLEQVTESLLKQWLAHSRTLRLSVLEKIADEKSWQALVGFIERYGRDLFTQRFLNMGNLRAILHQGVDAWLAKARTGARRRRGIAADRRSGREAAAGARRSSILSLVIEADRRKLHRVPRLQQHDHAIGSRRSGLHAVGFSPPARALRPRGLAS